MPGRQWQEPKNESQICDEAQLHWLEQSLPNVSWIFQILYFNFKFIKIIDLKFKNNFETYRRAKQGTILAHNSRFISRFTLAFPFDWVANTATLSLGLVELDSEPTSAGWLDHLDLSNRQFIDNIRSKSDKIWIESNSLRSSIVLRRLIDLSRGSLRYGEQVHRPRAPANLVLAKLRKAQNAEICWQFWENYIDRTFLLCIKIKFLFGEHIAKSIGHSEDDGPFRRPI